ncbi:uncharacterized protein zgc:174863 isoform X2 [Pleuronectes platessa]|uniref:uncharacterized protein zgc:174863 isoform X2 n=1 Tax=Pleuronectes platessa TaxID=8262 RepID=UPI00232A7503|nr:uncharacterized protein zgc:174863 isoform X2 [Pleuronectes platessa]
MALIGILILIFTATCVGAQRVFATLECNSESFGKHGQQSLLECVLKPIENAMDIEIKMVSWRKVEVKEPSLFFNKGILTSQTDYMFAEPSWNSKNLNVSLLITKTTVAQAGVYECVVLTNYGIFRGTTNLKVTAKYSEPNVSSIPEKITQRGGALICDSYGGYPEGEIHWIDEYGTDWTKSSEMKPEQGPNGLFHLSSKLTLLPGSIFSKYTCVVVNASGGREGWTEFEIEDPPRVDGQEGVEKSNSTSKIVAPVLVIGSLIVGLLMVLLYRRRRQKNMSHQEKARNSWT